MDSENVARELVAVAKLLVGSSIQTKAVSGKDIMKMMVDMMYKGGRIVYPIIDVSGPDFEASVTGHTNAVADYLKDGFKNGTIDSWRLIEFTTDRNDARGMADEV